MSTAEKTKEQRIQAEFKRIFAYFATMAENQRAIITPLVQNAAFMKVALEDLQTEINENGVTEEYKNGENQYGVKQSAALQSYTALIAKYHGVIDKLLQRLPEGSGKSKLEMMMADE